VRRRWRPRGRGGARRRGTGVDGSTSRARRFSAAGRVGVKGDVDGVNVEEKALGGAFRLHVERERRDAVPQAAPAAGQDARARGGDGGREASRGQAGGGDLPRQAGSDTPHKARGRATMVPCEDEGEAAVIHDGEAVAMRARCAMQRARQGRGDASFMCGLSCVYVRSEGCGGATITILTFHS
jgi:hypothetical protein